MTTAVRQARIESHRGLSLGTSLPTWAWVLVSRLLVLTVAAVSATVGRLEPGWVRFDPSRSSAQLGWLGNLLAAGADRWDSIHYLQVAQHGYSTPSNTSFFPLYPLLIRLTGPALGSDVVAGVAISCLCFAVALVLLHRLASAELGPEVARSSVVLLAFAPLSLFFSAVYSESLFLLLSVGTFMAARQERWWLAALLAGLAGITRVPGILLVAPVLYMWWRSEQRPRSALAWLALAPLPLLGFLLYLDSLGLGLLAPLAQESQWGHSMAGPINTLWLAVRWSVTAPGSNLPQLTVVIMALVSLVGCWRRLPKAYAIYSTLALIVVLWSPTHDAPLQSVDRYILTIFPLWLVAAAWIRERRLMLWTMTLELTMLAYYTSQFATWWFVA